MTRAVSSAKQDVVDTLAEARVFLDDVAEEQPNSVIAVCVSISVLDIATGKGRHFQQNYGSRLLSMLELNRILKAAQTRNPKLAEMIAPSLENDLPIEDIPNVTH